MHVWCCLTLLHPQTSVCPRKSQSSACIFLSFCLAPSLAHSLASFIISLLSVNLAPCLPLCLSLFFPPYPPSPSLPPSHFPSLHVPLSIVVICPVANSASVCLSRLCWQWLLFLMWEEECKFLQQSLIAECMGIIFHYLQQYTESWISIWSKNIY